MNRQSGEAVTAVVIAICLLFGIALDQATEPKHDIKWTATICAEKDLECQRGWRK